MRTPDRAPRQQFDDIGVLRVLLATQWAHAPHAPGRAGSNAGGARATLRRVARVFGRLCGARKQRVAH